jgi:hypothetical protein
VFQSAICRSLRSQYSGRLSFFYPVFERSERVEIRQSRTAGAMVNAGNRKNLKKSSVFLRPPIP